MASEFAALHAREQEDLIQFLLESFQGDPTVNSFRPQVISWKYFVDHPEWKIPRSWAFKENGKIVAHGGVWPLNLGTLATEIKAIHLVDWAASPSAVGAGVLLLKKMMSLSNIFLTIGGSSLTRSLLPKLGYKPCGELRRYARVVRPWLLFRTTPEKNWKTPIKYLRNSTRALTGIPEVQRGWHASKVTSFTGLINGSTLGQKASSISPQRTAAGLDHLLRCPAARISGFLISRAHQLRGYFLLAQVDRQVRIVDVRTDIEDQQAWCGICALIARTAAENAATCEVVAATSNEKMGDAWLRAGFVLCRADPIFCYDPGNLLSAERPLDLSFADGDACFLSDPRFPYLS
jgi:hypothetical protein